MTDNEIIKVLECCQQTHLGHCRPCPLYKNMSFRNGKCLDMKDKEALNLINRQQAEVERLKTEKDNLIKTYTECQIENIKNFAEKLKECVEYHTNDTGDFVPYVAVSDIDRLAKEWVGATDV